MANPTKKTEVFSTADDGQTAVDIHVLQGERELAADNMTLGRFRLDGIPPAPRGVPQIEVTFDIDANGILNVSARDKATGKEHKITITASTNLDKRDVERMVREAEAHAAEDKARRAKIELKNTADSLAYQAERTLQELGDTVDALQKGRAEQQIADLRQALEQEDESRIRSTMSDLQQTLQIIGQAAYGGQEREVGGSGAGRSQDEGVVEGEYTVE